jgi:C-terminal processing protease CtpA/Prc
VVKQLVDGGPAHLAGIRVGDIITHIDGKPTEGSNFREMVEYRLRGRAGTAVMIKIQRPGERRPLVFKLVRRQLVIPPKK